MVHFAAQPPAATARVLALARARTALPAPECRRRIRRDAGLTLDEIAAALGVHPATVSAWELGTRTPGRRIAGQYAALLAELRAIVDERDDADADAGAGNAAA
jgi:transcriptional regulator with XRE-family HTH domain